MSKNAIVPAGLSMPLWSDLAASLESEIRDYQANNALDALSAYEHLYGRSNLVEKLSELLLVDRALPSTTHKEFCSIPFDIVCTTNFDFLLENQYQALSRNVHPIVSEDQLSIDSGRFSTVLLKIHGDLFHPSRLVVTEEDYDGFLTQFPLLATYLSNLLITRTAVLTGYSLDDPDLRQLWHTVNQRLGKSRRKAYTLTVGAKSTDIARFARRGIEVINFPGSPKNYAKILADVFSELRQYYIDNILSVSSPTEEDLLRELQLPPDAATRICFFSVPLRMLPFYKEYVFPEIENIGLIPLSSDDIVSPGDNIVAKTEAIVARSAIVVVEPHANGSRDELEYALSKRERDAEGTEGLTPLYVISVFPKGVEGIFDATTDLTLQRNTDYYEPDDEFVMSLIRSLKDIAPRQLARQTSEPQRLLDMREYRAAIISALSLLEVTLRKKLDLAPAQSVNRPMSMSRLLDLATNQGLVNVDQESTIRSWMRIRNEVAHTTKRVSAEIAIRIVQGVNSLIRVL